MNIYELKHLSFRYPYAAALALADINLEIAPGEFLGITGPTGAGKSTLLKCLNGIIPHFQRGYLQGSVSLQGKSVVESSIAQIAHTVGTVLDDPDAQIITMEVEQELAFVLENRGVHPENMASSIQLALKRTGLSHLLKANPNTLSGGQKQRLAIAASLVTNPQILVLDEPTSELDPRGTGEIYAVLNQLNRDQGMSIIVVEQNVEILARYASRIIVLDQGAIAVEGSPRRVFSKQEILQHIGVQIPQVADLCLRLGANEMDLPLTEEEGYQYIQQRMAGARR